MLVVSAKYKIRNVRGELRWGGWSTGERTECLTATGNRERLRVLRSAQWGYTQKIYGILRKLIKSSGNSQDSQVAERRREREQLKSA
jgi:hypothetical protein